MVGACLTLRWKELHDGSHFRLLGVPLKEGAIASSSHSGENCNVLLLEIQDY
jgi:hypothetical protein